MGRVRSSSTFDLSPPTIGELNLSLLLRLTTNADSYLTQRLLDYPAALKTSRRGARSVLAFKGNRQLSNSSCELTSAEVFLLLLLPTPTSQIASKPQGLFASLFLLSFPHELLSLGADSAAGGGLSSPFRGRLHPLGSLRFLPSTLLHLVRLATFTASTSRSHLS